MNSFYSDTRKKNFLLEYLTGFLSILLIISFIFIPKGYEPAENLLVSGSILFYPITFIIVMIIYKKYDLDSAKRSIFTSCIMLISFLIMIMFASLFKASNVTSGYASIINYVFVNNVKTIAGINIYYPNLSQLLATIISYITSHLLFIVIYNAIKDSTIDYLSFGLGIFISTIIDRIIFVPILYMNGLINGSNTFEYFIKCLTSEFIFTILSALIICTAYIFYGSFKKLIKNK